ncbi:DUF4249 domain-containing protein [Anditalea andensis]|nr:DUF4249 domain-containing protein [Anditalea andensis]
MQKSTSILMLLFLIGISACETFLVMELPPHEPKFVINTSLEVGKPIRVFVSKSRSVLQDNHFERVSDASVEIMVDGQISYPLYSEEVLNNGTKMLAYTTTEVEIEVGRTYEIIVSGEGMQTARGKTTVPTPVEIKSVDLRSAPRNNRYGYVDFSVIFDDSQGSDFYEITVLQRGTLETIDGIDPERFIINQLVNLEPRNSIYENDFRYRTGLLFDDGLFDGREAKMEFGGVLYADIDLEITVFLKVVTSDYFNYENSLNLQETNRGDPIAQPVQVINNIQGGFGIIKAAVTSSYTLPFNNSIE